MTASVLDRPRSDQCRSSDDSLELGVAELRLLRKQNHRLDAEHSIPASSYSRIRSQVLSSEICVPNGLRVRLESVAPPHSDLIELLDQGASGVR